MFEKGESNEQLSFFFHDDTKRLVPRFFNLFRQLDTIHPIRRFERHVVTLFLVQASHQVERHVRVVGPDGLEKELERHLVHVGAIAFVVGRKVVFVVVVLVHQPLLLQGQVGPQINLLQFESGRLSRSQVRQGYFERQGRGGGSSRRIGIGLVRRQRHAQQTSARNRDGPIVLIVLPDRRRIQHGTPVSRRSVQGRQHALLVHGVGDPVLAHAGPRERPGSVAPRTHRGKARHVQQHVSQTLLRALSNGIGHEIKHRTPPPPSAHGDRVAGQPRHVVLRAARGKGAQIPTRRGHGGPARARGRAHAILVAVESQVPIPALAAASAKIDVARGRRQEGPVLAERADAKLEALGEGVAVGCVSSGSDVRVVHVDGELIVVVVAVRDHAQMVPTENAGAGVERSGGRGKGGLSLGSYG